MANNLGSVLQDLGEMEKAKSCFERALKIDEKAFGLEHPSVARDVNNLGLVLLDLGEMEKAENASRGRSRSVKRLFGLRAPTWPEMLTTSAGCC